jgi:hypothetical protein
VLSGDEQDRWRRIERDLAGDRRLVRLAGKLTTRHIGPGLPVRTCLFWLLGGLTGAAGLVAGSLTHTGGLVAAGVAVLVVTVLVAGVLLIAVGMTDDRGPRPVADD